MRDGIRVRADDVIRGQIFAHLVHLVQHDPRGMVRVEFLDPLPMQAQPVQHVQRQFVIDIPRHQCGMVPELFHIRLYPGIFVFFRLDVRRAPGSPVIQVLHRVDHFQPPRVYFVHHFF